MCHISVSQDCVFLTIDLEGWGVEWSAARQSALVEPQTCGLLESCQVSDESFGSIFRVEIVKTMVL